MDSRVLIKRIGFIKIISANINGIPCWVNPQNLCPAKKKSGYTVCENSLKSRFHRLSYLVLKNGIQGRFYENTSHRVVRKKGHQLRYMYNIFTFVDIYQTQNTMPFDSIKVRSAVICSNFNSQVISIFCLAFVNMLKSMSLVK